MLRPTFVLITSHLFFVGASYSQYSKELTLKLLHKTAADICRTGDWMAGLLIIFPTLAAFLLGDHELLQFFPLIHHLSLR